MSNSFHCTGLSPHRLTLFLGILFGAIINGIVLHFSGNSLLYRNAIDFYMTLYPATSKFVLVLTGFWWSL